MGESLITPRRAGLIAFLCIAAAGVASWLPAFRSGAFVLVFAAIFLVGSAFTTAGRTARSLQRVRGAHVRVVAWGLPLPGSDGPLFVDSVASLGVGLLIRLKAAPNSKRILLKIAQPRDILLSGDQLTIGRAAYIQWSSRRLKRSSDGPALVLVLEPAPNDLRPDSGAPAA